MSQAKVDARKREKATRKETMKKNKIRNIVTAVITACVCLCIVAWVGFSVRNNIVEKQKQEVVTVNYDAINDYMNGLQ